MRSAMLIAVVLLAASAAGCAGRNQPAPTMESQAAHQPAWMGAGDALGARLYVTHTDYLARSGALPHRLTAVPLD